MSRPSVFAFVSVSMLACGGEGTVDGTAVVGTASGGATATAGASSKSGAGSVDSNSESGDVSTNSSFAGPPPHELSDYRHCGDSELSGLANVCEDSASGGEVVASRGALRVRSTSLVQLSASAGENYASVSFTPESSGAFTIFLGTPNIPFAISANAGVITPVCSRYLTPELAQELTGTECTYLLGAYVVVLQSGTSYLLHFGPIAPEQWVRVYVQTP